jgi:hypothetical protein
MATAVAADITTDAGTNPNAVLELIRAASTNEDREVATNKQIIEANMSLVIALMRAGYPMPMLSELGSDDWFRIVGHAQRSGLGKISRGTVTLTGQPGDTETLVISDDGGTTDYTFEADSNDVFTAANEQVKIGTTIFDTADQLIGAINGCEGCDIMAMRGDVWAGSVATVWLIGLDFSADNDDAITDNWANTTVTGMSNGEAPT